MTSFFIRKALEQLGPIQKRFIESQLRNARRKKHGRSFTPEEKADAIALWKSSPRTYRLLSKMFVMPSVSTLKATLSQVPGISKPIFEVLKKQIGQIKNRTSRFCTLVFDEVALQPHLDYLPHEDRVMGFVDDHWNDNCQSEVKDVEDHACVFMLRGFIKGGSNQLLSLFVNSH